jgi:hypothetical protein
MKKIVLSALLTVSLYSQNQIMEVYKPITSTCPQSWLDDINKEVDEVKIVSLTDVKGLKQQIGIPHEIQSCNTSILNEYVFEGNVPSLAIKDFFKNIPKNAIRLSLPAYENEKEEKQVFIMFEDKTYKEFGKYH